MSAPRHLWSGDWQLESAAAAEELAERRGQIAEPLEPEAESAPVGAEPSRLARVIAWLRDGAAWGVTSLLGGSGGQAASAAGKADQWLGISVAGSPLGVVITGVVPGSPAGDAGLERGDLLSQVNNQPIGTVDSVGPALSGLHPGDQIEIQFSRGPAIFTTLATLGPLPPGYP
jgi:membrane-associated protease RseP (regulator of RpoE activity)